MYTNSNELTTALASITTATSQGVTIQNHTLLKSTVIDLLVTTAVFAPDETLKNQARDAINQLAKAAGIVSASTHTLYTAFAAGKLQGITIPAINIRTLSYDMAQTLFTTAMEKNVGAWLFEIAKSEMGYTEQSFAELKASIFAAAIKTGYHGPVFLQADHCQFSSKRYIENKEQEITHLKEHITQAINAGFYNIDIDASTLVDVTLPDLAAQQTENIQMTALLTNHIRSLQPQNKQITIGGEIGHIGGKNSTPADFEAFMQGYLSKITTGGINKVSVQTGSTHGGMLLPSGTIAPVNLDFSVLTSIGTLAREQYQLAGVVQHGASTLPKELFSTFPQTPTVEIHLSTGFQNIIFDHLPDTLAQQMYAWVKEHCSADRKPDWNDEQFLYKTRKKALGPFKKTLWELSPEDKQPLLTALSQEFAFLFGSLGVSNTTETVAPYIN